MVTSEDGTSIGRVLVGIDGSAGSAAALRWATRLALATGAEVRAVHVIEPTRYDLRPLGLPPAILNEADWREEIMAELKGTWCEPLVEAGVRHRTRIEEGRAGPCLTGIARQEHADLVVTGRRGLSAMAELVQGSVSSYVTHHAPCPVTVVPAQAQAA
jgi:nucleotide-binding universal stress UspA family protein